MKPKITLGTAGIPLGCSGNSIEAISYIKEIGLQAMEVEFVRGIHMSNKTAMLLGETAKQHEIKLSVHAPYYINLASHEKRIVLASKKRIIDSMERAHYMGAKIIVVHAGYYGKHSDEECHKIILKECEEIIKYVLKKKWKVKLGIETMAKPKSYGKVEEVLRLCSKLKQTVPVVDFGHIFAYNGGKINYGEVLEKFKRYGHIHSHFSNMKKNKKGIYVDIHKPMDHEPAFKPLAKELIKRKEDITIISESPVIEKDSLKMKKILEKMGYKFI